MADEGKKKMGCLPMLALTTAVIIVLMIFPGVLIFGWPNWVPDGLRFYHNQPPVIDLNEGPKAPDQSADPCAGTTIVATWNKATGKVTYTKNGQPVANAAAAGITLTVKSGAVSWTASDAATIQAAIVTHQKAGTAVHAASKNQVPDVKGDTLTGAEICAKPKG